MFSFFSSSIIHANWPGGVKFFMSSEGVFDWPIFLLPEYYINDVTNNGPTNPSTNATATTRSAVGS